MNLLLLDNDVKFREKFKSLLESVGMNVIECESLEKKYLDDIHSKNIDFALIDRRTKDDNNEFDTSGDSYAKKIFEKGIPTALITAYKPSDYEILEMIRRNEISGVFNKNNDLDEIIACIRYYDNYNKLPNGIATFIWADELCNNSSKNSWQILCERISYKGDYYELAALFRAVIPPYVSCVNIDPLTPGHGGASIVKSTISFDDAPVEMELAIKYGQKQIIWSELFRYDRFVNLLPDGAAARLMWNAQSNNLGALAYSWVGDSVEDGISLGPVECRDVPLSCEESTFNMASFNDGEPVIALKSIITWDRRRNSIRRLFNAALDKWYKLIRVQKMKNEFKKYKTLCDYYLGNEGIWYRKEQQLEKLNISLGTGLPKDFKIAQKGESWHFSTIDETLLDPIHWIRNGNGKSLVLKNVIPCHGDLHVKNIYVLSDDSPRLIDFGDTGLGHIYRDFVALESSLLMTCICTKDLWAIRDAQNNLCTAKSLGDSINYRNKSWSKYLQEVIKTVTDIRRMAFDATQINRMDEYLFAIVMYMLRYASGVADEIPADQVGFRSEERKWHALFAAAKAATESDNIIKMNEETKI